jgi:DNA-binding transcriptional LysR family regulator
MHKPHDLPALDLLKAFESAARHLSFTRAGTELYLSQSAVSRQIQQLENQLGVPLFIRRTRALLLTEQGQRYYRDVSQALHQLREAGANLSTINGGHIVTVTTTLTFASLWLVPQLVDFQQQHPQIEIRIAAGNAVRDLERDRMDVAIRYATPKLVSPEATRLFGESVLPVCSPQLLKNKRPQRPGDLNDFVLLHYEDPTMFTPWLSWEVWFETMKAAAPAPRGVLRFSHYDMMVRAAIGGQGIALGRLPLIESMLDDGTLVAPLAGTRYSATTLERAYWMIATPSAQERAEVQTFMQWLARKAAPLARRTGIRKKLN